MIVISRRRFLALSGGLLAGTACSRGRDAIPLDRTTAPASTATGSTTTAVATTTVTAVTTTPDPDPSMPAAGDPSTDRVLVVVQLNGGNDGLNTLVPLDGRYRDARPTLAITESELLDVGSWADGYALHPSLAPLVPLIAGGRLAAIDGIGFREPDRSHFVSMDRWWRADRLDQPAGWLGRWLDLLGGELEPLCAVAFGGSPRIVTGEVVQPTSIADAASFTLPAIVAPERLEALGRPEDIDPIVAAAQRAFLRSVDAVGEFERIVTAPSTAGGLDAGTTAVTTGLSVAAELIAGSPGTRVVIVTTTGYDTHANQLADQAALLDDLANGIATFSTAIESSGDADRVLLATTSEFGRRVTENGSGGTDHGAAGLSLLLGTSIVPTVHGGVDWSALLDGDVPPVVDPSALFTACLDWLGADAEAVLGRRDDSLRLLR
jgi:uncharacterized protein (DUF1501 family)